MKSPKTILEDQKAPAVVLLALVTKTYGSEAYEWDPMTLKVELQEDFKCQITDLQSDKIQAAITILTTEQYEENIVVFETLNHLLNHQETDMDEMDPLEAEELIIGLTEAYLIKAEEMQFSPEVRVYAGVVFYNYGMHKVPDLFPQALMQEKEGDDKDKNEALQELFDEKLKVTKQYLDNAQLQ
jgi:hypothetical protein